MAQILVEVMVYEGASYQKVAMLRTVLINSNTSGKLISRAEAKDVAEALIKILSEYNSGGRGMRSNGAGEGDPDCGSKVCRENNIKMEG